MALGLVASAWSTPARAVDASAPAILQIFEDRWDTIEDRMADIHAVGYGRLWLPPPARADSGGLSVGYDVFDRFDLGKPRSETLYGTETGLKTLVRSAHSAGVLVNTDFIPNHNGFSDSSTVDNRGTATTADDVTFVHAGGYPGFVVTLPGDVDGDFHGAFEGGEQNFRLSGLIDIAQEFVDSVRFPQPLDVVSRLHFVHKTVTFGLAPGPNLLQRLEPVLLWRNLFRLLSQDDRNPTRREVRLPIQFQRPIGLEYTFHDYFAKTHELSPWPLGRS